MRLLLLSRSNAIQVAVECVCVNGQSICVSEGWSGSGGAEAGRVSERCVDWLTNCPAPRRALPPHCDVRFAIIGTADGCTMHGGVPVRIRLIEC